MAVSHYAILAAVVKILILATVESGELNANKRFLFYEPLI